MAEPRLLTIPVPHEGLDTDSAFDSIGVRKSPFLENFLVDRPGMLPIRGPINDSIDFQAIPAGGPKVVGVWAHNNNLLIGRRAQSVSAVRDPWAAPYRKAAAEADLATGVTTLKHVNLDIGTVTDVGGADQNQIPGPSWTRLGDHVYGIGFARVATNSVNYNGGFQWLTRILRWDGTASLPTVYTNCPHGAQSIKAHYRRLFVLGGRNPDNSGTLQPNALWFSDPTDAAALADNLTSWQDDTSGLVNQIRLLADDNDFGVALARVGTDLAILRRRSVWLLQGYSPSTFLVQPISMDTGCIDPRSVVEDDDGVYFMSDHGYVFFDGSQLVRISDQLRTTLLASALEVVGDRGIDGGRCVAANLHHGYIGVSVGVSDSITTGDSSTLFSAIYHTGSRGWVYLSSDALIDRFPVGFGHASTESFLFDDSRIFDTSKMTLPESAEAVDRGFDFLADTFRWVGTPLFNGTGNTLTDGAGTEMFPSGGTQPAIVARWHVPLIQIVSPINRGQFNRAILDYTWKHSPAQSGTAWNLLIYGSDGSLLLDETVDAESEAPADQGQILTQSYTTRQRAVMDFYAEASDVSITVQTDAEANGPAEANIQALYLVVQDAHTRRSDTS